MEREQILIRTAVPTDVQAIYELYQSVSKNKGGLARTEAEITMDYISHFVEKSMEKGLQLVAVDNTEDNKIIAEIHCYPLEPKVFAHILSELTIAVDSNYQGKGIGRKLFQKLLDVVKESRSDILRVELIARESNSRAIQLYQSLGFEIEGKLLNRIKNEQQQFEADIPMAWFNPNFELKNKQ